MGIKPKAMVSPNLHEAVGFYNPQLLFKFQVASSSRLEAIGKKLFLKSVNFKPYNQNSPKITSQKR